MQYVGRFAPSPTGPLHVGSLLTAVASYLHARRSAGQWLVRVEDIDPPREVHGATKMILAALEAFDLTWDREVFYQSRRVDDYRQMADELLVQGSAYRCSCSRRDIRGDGSAGPLGFRYRGLCRKRQKHDRATAIRVQADRATGSFHDGIQGFCRYDVGASTGDYVIFRNDGLPAYHLAVVIDDARQGITHVTRGRDLFAATDLHRLLQVLLGLPEPLYHHHRLLTDEEGRKLSKSAADAGLSNLRASGVPAREIRRLVGLG